MSTFDDDDDEFTAEEKARIQSDTVSVYNFIELLSMDDVMILSKILGRCMQDSVYAALLNGFIQANIRYKHNLCLCVVTDKEHAPSDHDHIDFPNVIPSRNNELGLDYHKQVEVKGIWSLLNEYHVRFTGPDTKGEVKCQECGMRYVSLQDRMLKEADGCLGCIEDMKWGKRQRD